MGGAKGGKYPHFKKTLDVQVYTQEPTLIISPNNCRSDLGPEVGFEATGLINGDLPTIGVWAKTSDVIKWEDKDYNDQALPTTYRSLGVSL